VGLRFCPEHPQMWDVGYEMWDVKERVSDLTSQISHLTSDLLFNSWVESRIRLKLVNDLEAA
jgi:hypothetical protein